MSDLTGRKVLFLATNGFETVELFKPRDALREVGAEVVLASITRDAIQGMEGDLTPAEKVIPDTTLTDVVCDDFDALVLPGGCANPDRLRQESNALQIVRDFMSSDKPVAAICHAPWLLAEAGVIRGRTLTGFASIRTDLRNAGGDVIDESIVIDGNLITSRKPDDLPDFIEAVKHALT